MVEVPIKVDLATRFSLYPSVPACFRALLAGMCHPTLTFSSPGGWGALPYIIQPFLLTALFELWASQLLRLVPLLS